MDTCLIRNALAIRPLAAGIAAVDRIRPLGGEDFSTALANPILSFFQSPLFQIFLITPVPAQTIIAIFLAFDQRVEIPSATLADDFPYNGIWSYTSDFFFIPLSQRFLIFVFPIAVPHGIIPSFHMLANSEFLVMLNQAATDRAELARLLNISDNQLSYITNVDFGRGLIKCGSAIVPFMDNFPKNRLYRLMTTTLSDMSDNRVY